MTALSAGRSAGARWYGGPSVYPPQPLERLSCLTQVPREWKTSVGPERYRRGMYTWFQRSAPHPGLIVFDAPDAGTTCTRRNRSNTPLQALTLLNDQAFLECAQRLAAFSTSADARPEVASDGERLRLVFVVSARSVLARDPSRASGSVQAAGTVAGPMAAHDAGARGEGLRRGPSSSRRGCRRVCRRRREQRG